MINQLYNHLDTINNHNNKVNFQKHHEWVNLKDGDVVKQKIIQSLSFYSLKLCVFEIN